MYNQSQFDAVYIEHKNFVYNLCLHYVLHSEDAQDITQEVFVKIYQNYHRFDPASASLKTWICRIAINQCLDFLKSKKTKKRFGFITSLFYPDSNEPITDALNINHPGIILENKEELERLLLIIQTLPENQKTAIILSKIEDKPQKEVAEIMNISIKAVESLLQRAKQNIKIKLNANEGF